MTDVTAGSDGVGETARIHAMNSRLARSCILSSLFRKIETLNVFMAHCREP